MFFSNLPVEPSLTHLSLLSSSVRKPHGWCLQMRKLRQLYRNSEKSGASLILWFFYRLLLLPSSTSRLLGCLAQMLRKPRPEHTFLESSAATCGR